MIHRLFGFALILFMVSGCSENKEQNRSAGKPVVYAVNYPLAYFAERIAGDTVEVVFPEMEGDPAFWEPAPEQVAEFQDADLVLLNGASYAKWVQKVSLSRSKLVDTSVGLKERYILLNDSINHTHGPGGEHAHGDVAFTIWLDPKIAMHQARSIHQALDRQWDVSEGNVNELLSELEALDASFETAFEGLGDRPMIGSHPVYQYLSRRYNLNMKSVHWEPDGEPDASMWEELTVMLKTHKADLMLWEDEPLPSVVKALDEKGIASIVFNPCGNRPVEGDFLSVMRDNADSINGLTSD